MTDPELLARIEKLERDNRRLKRFGVAALALVAALGLAAAARPVPNVIRAHRFEVVDSTGRVRIRMAASPLMSGDDHTLGSDIALFDAVGKKQEALNGNRWGGGIYLFDSRGEPAVTIEHSRGDMNYQKGRGWISAGSDNEITLYQPSEAGSPSRLGMYMDVNGSGEPSINMYGPQGYRMALGSTGLEDYATGEKRQTSADSIVMFGNNMRRRVIWQAP